MVAIRRVAASVTGDLTYDLIDCADPAGAPGLGGRRVLPGDVPAAAGRGVGRGAAPARPGGGAGRGDRGRRLWAGGVGDRLCLELVGAAPLTAAYPALDVILLGAVVGLLLVPAHRRPPAGGHQPGTAAGRRHRLRPEPAAHGGYGPGAALDLIWLASYQLWVAAALHPSMRTLGSRDRAESRRLPTLRLAVLTTAALTVPLSAALDITGRLDWPWIGTVTVLMLLIAARLTELVRGQQASALTYPLTGLPNRAALLA